jgi:hypothetical protein
MERNIAARTSGRRGLREKEAEEKSDARTETDALKIEGDWRAAIKNALGQKRPDQGWPQLDKPKRISMGSARTFSPRDARASMDARCQSRENYPTRRISSRMS